MMEIEHNPASQKSIIISNIDVFILASYFENEFPEVSETKSKSMLKVINKPIIAYQLEFLERNNIKEVYIITARKNSESLDFYINNLYQGDINAEVFLTNKENLDIFSIIKSKSKKSNFILLFGDLICNFDLRSVIDSHIREKNLLSLVLNKTTYLNSQKKLDFIQKTPFDIFGVESSQNDFKKIVYHKRKDPNSKDEIKISKRVLENASSFELLYNYEDTGIYIFNKNVFTILENYSEKIKKMSNIKTDFIPFLIKKQFSKKLCSFLSKEAKEKKLLTSNSQIKAKFFDATSKDKTNYVYRISSLQRYLSTIDEIQKQYNDIQLIYFQTKNNTKNYFVNFADKIQENVNNSKQFNDGVNEIECISMDSYVCDPVISLGKENRINRTVVGINLNLREGTKITSCLILDNVKIGKSCKITNCLIGDDATIGDNCVLTDCVVASGYNVSDGSNFSKKIISDGDILL